MVEDVTFEVRAEPFKTQRPSRLTTAVLIKTARQSLLDSIKEDCQSEKDELQEKCKKAGKGGIDKKAETSKIDQRASKRSEKVKKMTKEELCSEVCFLDALRKAPVRWKKPSRRTFLFCDVGEEESLYDVLQFIASCNDAREAYKVNVLSVPDVEDSKESEEEHSDEDDAEEAEEKKKPADAEDDESVVDMGDHAQAEVEHAAASVDVPGSAPAVEEERKHGIPQLSHLLSTCTTSHFFPVDSTAHHVRPHLLISAGPLCECVRWRRGPCSCRSCNAYGRRSPTRTGRVRRAFSNTCR